jgi:hypothetical protein
VRRLGRSGALVFALLVSIALLALPSSAGANVMVVGTGTTLELKLDSTVSSIAVSGSSDESVTIAELSPSAPFLSTTSGSGTSCLGGGTRR